MDCNNIDLVMSFRMRLPNTGFSRCFNRNIDGFTAAESPATKDAPKRTATPVLTATPTTELTQDWLSIFDQFIADVKNDVKGQIVGIWVEKILALWVVYQLLSDSAFVSTVDEVVTYFLYPWE